MENPIDEHYQVTVKLLKYVKFALAKGVFFPIASRGKFTRFADTDWGSYLDTRRFITGFCFLFDKALISCKCKKQLTVARSSSEVEYRSLITAACEA